MKKIVIGVSLLTDKQHSFYEFLQQGMEIKAKEYGWFLQFRHAEFDPEKQDENLRELMKKKPDAILISPVYCGEIGFTVIDINEAAIPVFTVDATNTGEKGEIVSFITSDNTGGGRMAADALAESINQRGEIAYIGRPEASTSEERLISFLNRIKKYPDIRIIANLALKTATRKEARRATVELLEKADKLSGIFCVNDECALGALIPVSKSGRKIQIVSFDGDERILKKVDAGIVYADIQQYPLEIGKKAIEIIRVYLSGGKVPRKVVIPVRLYKKKSELERDPKC